MSAIIIPAKLLKKALQYIEEHSDLIWWFGDAPTSYCPDCHDHWNIHLTRSNNGHLNYLPTKSNFNSMYYEFNKLDLFIKGD